MMKTMLKIKIIKKEIIKKKKKRKTKTKTHKNSRVYMNDHS